MRTRIAVGVTALASGGAPFGTGPGSPRVRRTSTFFAPACRASRRTTSRSGHATLRSARSARSGWFWVGGFAATARAISWTTPSRVAPASSASVRATGRPSTATVVAVI